MYQQRQDFIDIDKKMNLTQDTISNIEWFDDYIFGISSWDGSFKMFQIEQNSFTQVFEMNFDQPITTFTFDNQYGVYCALLNKEVLSFQIKNSSQQQNIHLAKNFISQMYLIHEENYLLVYTTKSIDIIDLQEGKKMCLDFDFEHIKTDMKGYYFVSIFTHNKYSIYTLNDIFQNGKIQYADCDLKTQLSSVCWTNVQNQIMLAGIDGRIQINNLSNSEKSIIFLGHTNNQHYSYQVNDLQFGVWKDKYFLASAGGDCNLKIWDTLNKDIFQTILLNGPITNLCLNPNEQLMVVCNGYDWSKGVQGISEIDYIPNIQVLVINDKLFSKSYGYQLYFINLLHIFFKNKNNYLLFFLNIFFINFYNFTIFCISLFFSVFVNLRNSEFTIQFVKTLILL